MGVVVVVVVVVGDVVVVVVVGIIPKALRVFILEDSLVHIPTWHYAAPKVVILIVFVGLLLYPKKTIT